MITAAIVHDLLRISNFRNSIHQRESNSRSKSSFRSWIRRSNQNRSPQPLNMVECMQLWMNASQTCHSIKGPTFLVDFWSHARIDQMTGIRYKGARSAIQRQWLSKRTMTNVRQWQRKWLSKSRIRNIRISHWETNQLKSCKLHRKKTRCSLQWVP